jgi:hypothetical protein
VKDIADSLLDMQDIARHADIHAFWGTAFKFGFIRKNLVTNIDRANAVCVAGK